MCAALGDAGLGQVLDIVPNHMAIVGGNRWWWDVLENGPSSQYASYFDVDWDPPEAKLRNTVLMPILGDHYGRVLEAGEFRLTRDEGAFTVHYYDHVVPVAPRSLDDLLAGAARRCRSMELESLATFFGRLPPSYLTDRASVRERHRDKEVLRASLARLLREEPDVAAAVDAEVAAVNADPDRLDALLERQNYRLAFWRTAGRELDYRRFFDIHTLAALRMEDEAVFLDTHDARHPVAGPRAWSTGCASTIPTACATPRATCGASNRRPDRRPGWWWRRSSSPASGCPQSWPVAGTTGYDFTNRVGGPVRRPGRRGAAQRGLHRLHRREHRLRRGRVREEASRDVGGALVGDQPADRPGHRGLRAPPALPGLHPPRPARDPAGADRRLPRLPHLRGPRAGHRHPTTSPTWTRRPSWPAAGGPTSTASCSTSSSTSSSAGTGAKVEDELVARFQQVTGPVMAKGVEDTTFYTFNRLVALNEVGGNPGRFGIEPGGVPRRERLDRPPLARHPAGHLDPRHQALRGHPGPHRPAVGDPARLRRSGVGVVPAQRAAPAGPVAPRPQRRVAPVPDAGRRLAALGRAGRRLHGEGVQGGQGAHELGRPRSRSTTTPCGSSSRASSPTGSSPPRSRASSLRWSSRAGSTPWPRRC